MIQRGMSSLLGYEEDFFFLVVALSEISARIFSMVVMYFVELNSLRTRSQDLFDMEEAMLGLLIR